MRTHLQWICLIAGLSASQSYAQSQTISLGSEYRSVQGSLNPSLLLNGPGNSINEMRSVLGYKVEDFVQALTLSGSLVHVMPDYSGYLLTTRTGGQTPLSQQFTLRNEFLGSAFLTWASGPVIASLGWSGSLSPSPFYMQSVALRTSYSFYNKTSTIGTQLLWSAQDQPLSYYIDTDFITRARPKTLHSTAVAAFWEQILTERWKSSVQFTGGTRIEDRPPNLGVSVRQGYAMLDRLFSQLAFSTARELTTIALKDDRGYFSMSAVESSLTYEPWIDFLVTASYAIVAEYESNPNTQNSIQVGSDQFGLAFNYRTHGWGFDLKSSYHITNTQLHSLSVSGGLTWQI